MGLRVRIVTSHANFGILFFRACRCVGALWCALLMYVEGAGRVSSLGHDVGFTAPLTPDRLRLLRPKSLLTGLLVLHNVSVQWPRLKEYFVFVFIDLLSRSIRTSFYRLLIWSWKSMEIWAPYRMPVDVHTARHAGATADHFTRLVLLDSCLNQ